MAQFVVRNLEEVAKKLKQRVKRHARSMEEDFSSRVLILDEMAAMTAAQIAADRQRAGHVLDLRDTLIAGIAQARRATIATRHARHFDGLDVPVVDPWHA